MPMAHMDNIFLISKILRTDTQLSLTLQFTHLGIRFFSTCQPVAFPVLEKINLGHY